VSEQFERRRATMTPARTDDLKDGAADWIGVEWTWQACWVIEDGPVQRSVGVEPVAGHGGHAVQPRRSAVRVGTGVRPDVHVRRHRRLKTEQRPLTEVRGRLAG
jgi:hypothetical protein